MSLIKYRTFTISILFFLSLTSKNIYSLAINTTIPLEHKSHKTQLKEYTQSIDITTFFKENRDNFYAATIEKIQSKAWSNKIARNSLICQNYFDKLVKHFNIPESLKKELSNHIIEIKIFLGHGSINDSLNYIENLFISDINAEKLYNTKIEEQQTKETIGLFNEPKLTIPNIDNTILSDIDITHQIIKADFSPIPSGTFFYLVPTDKTSVPITIDKQNNEIYISKNFYEKFICSEENRDLVEWNIGTLDPQPLGKLAISFALNILKDKNLKESDAMMKTLKTFNLKDFKELLKDTETPELFKNLITNIVEELESSKTNSISENLEKTIENQLLEIYS